LRALSNKRHELGVVLEELDLDVELVYLGQRKDGTACSAQNDESQLGKSPDLIK
jgi:hypothetical protein